MADVFSIQSIVQVTPLEEIEFTDTTQKAKGIHSSIDRVFSGSVTSTHGATATNVALKSYTAALSSDFVSLTTILSLSAFTCTSLFVKLIVMGDGDGTPRVALGASTISNYNATSFSAVGDFVSIPKIYLSTDNIFISATDNAGTTACQFEILYGIT